MHPTHPDAVLDFPVAVMDGDCALCSFGARMIHRLDRRGDIRIARVQTPLGRQLMVDAGLDPDDPATWLFIENGQQWTDVDAIIRIGARSGGWGRIVAALWVVPAPLRRWGYGIVARNRYRLFGRRDMCALPDPAFRARLLP